MVIINNYNKAVWNRYLFITVVQLTIIIDNSN